MTFGRGGAGNLTLPPTTIKPSTLPHQPHNNSPTKPNYSTGRGGVGNMHHATSEDRRIFSFDEELAKQGKATAAPVYHIGRGGQGNTVVTERRESDASASSRASTANSKRGSLDWVRGLARGSKN